MTDVVDTNELARMNGFADAEDMFRHIGSLDLTKPEAMEAFLKWRSGIWSKQGLIAVYREVGQDPPKDA